jgi:4-amino-4-deoxy-L-arabinose transferase-like glycosyltransferase
MFRNNRAINLLQNQVFVALCIVVLLILKAPYIHLPYYWDEAWSYAKAVNEMYTHKITVFPSEVNQSIFRGHPLFFYALTGFFARLSGFSPMSMHIWMLVMASACAILFYYLVSRVYDESVALLAFVFVLFQETMIVQSSFLLPEILIAYLSIFSLLYYSQKQFVLYIVCGTLLVLTKESGIVTILAICMHSLMLFLIKREFTFAAFRQLLLCSTPLMVFALFILLQKLKWGWYLFPEHTALMNFSTDYIISRLTGFKGFVFCEQHRKYFSWLVLICIPLFFIVRRKLFYRQILNEKILLLLIFVILYCAFSSVNFYSARYMISLLPVFALFAAIVITSLISDKRINTAISMLVGIYFVVTFLIRPSDDLGDTSKNYTKVVSTQKDMFTEFIALHPRDTFGGDFLTNVNLQNKEMGYLKDNVMTTLPMEEAQYVIATCIEPNDERIQTWLKSGIIKLVYEKKNGLAWSRVYKRN